MYKVTNLLGSVARLSKGGHCVYVKPGKSIMTDTLPADTRFFKIERVEDKSAGMKTRAKKSRTDSQSRKLKTKPKTEN